jgi:formamidopyrimidine-DNA glycosylase
MPELPEVEIVKIGLEKIKAKTVKKIFRSNKKLRIESTLNLEKLKNAQIVDIKRRARYLIVNFSNDLSLIIHLGMSGKITLVKNFNQQKHDHFAIQFSDDIWLIFNDVRRFGFIDLIESKKTANHFMLSKLGIEPLSNDLTTDFLYKITRDKKTNIKSFLMDNSFIVGVGNIYANESLFLSKISPLRKTCEITKKEAEILAQNIKKILVESIKKGGSSISDYINVNGDSGYFQNDFFVYGRENQNCKNIAENSEIKLAKKTCQGKILRIKQNSRSTFYCSKCQK